MTTITLESTIKRHLLKQGLRLTDLEVLTGIPYHRLRRCVAFENRTIDKEALASIMYHLGLDPQDVMRLVIINEDGDNDHSDSVRDM